MNNKLVFYNSKKILLGGRQKVGSSKENNLDNEDVFANI